MQQLQGYAKVMGISSACVLLKNSAGNNARTSSAHDFPGRFAELDLVGFNQKWELSGQPVCYPVSRFAENGVNTLV